MMEKDDNDKFCRMGVVEEVKEGPDGCVRTATVRYTNPGGDPCSHSNPKLVVRPIHKLAVIVPVDYRFEEDLAGEERAKPGELTKPATRWRPRRGREGNLRGDGPGKQAQERSCTKGNGGTKKGS
jgi:hypothetical protein